MKLIVATGNKNKAIEISSILQGKFEVLTLKDIGFFEEIEETGLTFNENASIKSQFIFNKFKENCIADDSGLAVDALNGKPGVYSARYAGTPSNDEKNIILLLENLKGKVNRNAKFITVLSFIENGTEYFFEGILNGTITTELKGSNGFGYDPIFIPDGYNETLAEMTLEDKNNISHRAIAIKKFAKFLEERN